MEPVSPDARLSNYRLERLLGAGGMGSVYLAHDLALDRRVAIKFISPERAGDENARRRLIREARAAAALEHPNICGVHEVIVEPDGRACIVMQYVDGETLAERLRSGPLDVRLALSVTTEIASALAAAHKRGIVHRDIKPGNIILTAEHKAKLLDFGLALQTTPLPGSEDDSTITGLTAMGAVAGTPSYMSPEQIEGKSLDGRSDLFALGSVLYECLTGQRAFDGRSRFETAQQILYHHPPAPSTVRKELTEQHDELCGRLLAKHPDDRFRSADELLGALRVLAPSTHSGVHMLGTDPPVPRARARVRLRPYPLIAAALVLIVALAGMWRWSTPSYERTVTPEAKRLYLRGTELIRDGAYHSGHRAMQGAVAASPEYVPAYIRLGEAAYELDDERGAQDALNTIGTLVENEGRLSAEDRLRLRAVRALMLRRVDDTVEEYEQLTELLPRDAGAWVDLGRAQDAAARPLQARESFERAIQLQPENPAAHLRRATVLSQIGEREEALREFGVAEDLYSRLGNADGQTEALLRRASFLNGLGEFAAAREALEKARTLALSLEYREQFIRAQLGLSNVTAAEGNFARAEAMAREAVTTALAENLDTVAAEGLIDLANALLLGRTHDIPEATVLKSIDTHLESAIDLARRRNAPRIAARARMQRAAVLLKLGDPAKAVEAAREVLQFLQENHYRRYELQTLLIMARSLEQVGDHEQGRQVSEDVLRTAEQIHDDANAAIALENLAGFAIADGNLPLAETYQRRSEDINRAQKNLTLLPFDLTNRAELLIRLGRTSEADALLAEVEAGIKSDIESFKERERRASALRALQMVIEGRFAEAARIAGSVARAGVRIKDSPGRLSAALLVYAESRLGKRPGEADWRVAAEAAPAAALTEARYWFLYALLVSGNDAGALSGARESLAAQSVRSSEFEWRLAAIGAAAARKQNAVDQVTAMSTRADGQLRQLRTAWANHTQSYIARPDLQGLIEKAWLNQQP